MQKKTQSKSVEKVVEKHMPEVKFKSGSLQATVWKNEATKEDGEVFENFSFTIERTYLDDKETKVKGQNVFKKTTSMRKRDTASFIALSNRVMDYLFIDEDPEVDQKE